MCYESLVNDDATEKPLGELIREEMGSAVVDAGIATTVVVLMLAVAGTPPLLVAGAAVGAVGLTLVVHQLVLVAGVLLVRWRTSSPAPHGDPA